VIESWSVASRVDWATHDDQGGRLVRVLWGGTERRGTARLQRVDWDGSLTARGGTLELIEAINFQSIADEARSVSAERIEWCSKTAGNAAGVVVRVFGDDCELSFESEPKQFQMPMNQFATEQRVEAGGVNRFVQIGPPPTPGGSLLFEQTTSDSAPLPGIQPYWIRVVQTDQSLAWSSPVYVTSQS